MTRRYRTNSAISTSCLLSAVLICSSVLANPNLMSGPAAEPESAIELSNRLIRQSDAYREEIARLETLYGPYDPVLLEPLASLASTMAARRDYETVQELHERSLQIVRIELGLDSLSQRPILERAIENDIRLGDWSSASARFESIYNLMDENTQQMSAALLSQAREMKSWYLHAILLDSPDLWEQQGRRIGELQRNVMAEADELFADDQQNLVPWLYQDAIDEYRSVSVRRIRGFLGKAPRIFLTEIFFRSREQSIANTFDNLKRIRRIFADHNDLEGEAMAMIYLADLRLMTTKGSAPFLYRAAMDQLLEAGIPDQKIAEFFSRPAMLPTLEFHATLDAALADQEDKGFLTTSNTDTGSGHTFNLGSYYAWHPYLPGIERPPLPEAASNLQLNYETVKLRFSLNSRGQARNVEVLESSTVSAVEDLDAIRGIEAIRFRPRFEGRQWQSTDEVTVDYFYPRLSKSSLAALN